MLAVALLPRNASAKVRRVNSNPTPRYMQCISPALSANLNGSSVCLNYFVGHYEDMYLRRHCRHLTQSQVDG